MADLLQFMASLITKMKILQWIDCSGTPPYVTNSKSLDVAPEIAKNYRGNWLPFWCLGSLFLFARKSLYNEAFRILSSTLNLNPKLVHVGSISIYFYALFHLPPKSMSFKICHGTRQASLPSGFEDEVSHEADLTNKDWGSMGYQ